MGKLDKDLHQKENAIRFCILTGQLPFLEVIVQNKRELSDTSTIVTDIDVLGLLIDGSGELKRVIFDCKTLSKTSPINRTFWASGLMKYTNCDEAFIILNKKASEAHRLTAKSLNVHLFNNRQFSNYAESHSLDYNTDYCYSTAITNWESLFDVYSNASQFEKFGSYINNEIPLETDPARGIRRLLAALLKGKGEFDPEKPAHHTVFQQVLMTFSYLMSLIVHDLKKVIDFDSDKKEFEKILRYYMWGGRDAFKQKQKMSELFASKNHKMEEIELELREWSLFVELIRKLLDSPLDIFKCCFPTLEISLRNIVKRVEDKDLFLAKTISSSNRIRQFLLLQARYLTKAAKLPHEFDLKISTTLDELIHVEP